MQIAILGPLEVSVGGRSVPLTGMRLRTLLVRLAVDAPKPVAAGELIDAVWQDEPPADAANALQSLVSRLRRAFADPALITAEPAGYRLEADRGSIDLHRFAELTAQAGRLQRQGRAEDALAACTTALDMWRGEPLVDAAGADYAHPIVTACQSYRLDAISTRIDALLELGRGAELITELDELISSHPLREGFIAQRLRALAAAGRISEALSAYEQFRHYLAEELGTDPGPELQSLQLALLRGEQVTPAAMPTEPGSAVPKTNLRPALTSFIGREAELARIARSLGSARLTTIVGPGGAGKTRIAAEAARQWMHDHDQPAWMVELAPVGTAENIVGAMLGALGLGDLSIIERTDPVHADELQRLLDHLAATDCLLVIDNCEHLIDGVAQLVEELLTRAPSVRILATSREPLALTAETLCPLPPLQLPPADSAVDQASGYAAVRLWIDRASAVVSGYQLTEDDREAVLEIVRRLDGLPLAIELAAARLRVLPVADIARRLSDRFRLLTGGNRTSLPRHRTLRAVVEWSWDLLSDAERLLAERLAIFPGGAGIDSATAICGDDRLPADEIADLMISLADKSLLEHSNRAPVRFRMLETIREYGIEQLDGRQELAQIRARHADFYYDLALELEPQFRDHRQRSARMIMDRERDNVLAALRYLIDDGDPHRALMMVLAMYWDYQVRDQEQEAGYWLGQVISAVGQRAEPLLIYAEALHSMTNLQQLVADDESRVRLEMSGLMTRLAAAPDPPFPGLEVLRARLPIFLSEGDDIAPRLDDMVSRAERTEDPWIRGAIFATASWMAENAGDWEGMAQYTEDAYEAFSLTGDAWGLSAVLSQRAQLFTIAGRTDDAIDALRQSLDLAPLIGSRDDVLITNLRLAALELSRGNAAAARDHLRQMQATASTTNLERERDLLCGSMEGGVLLAEGNYADAAELAERLRDSIDEEMLSSRFSSHASALALITAARVELTMAERDDHPRDRIDQAVADLRRGYQPAVITQDVPILSEFVAATALLALSCDQPGRGARLLGASTGLVGIPRPTDPRQVALGDQLRTLLGADAFAAEFAAGHRLSRAEVIELTDPACLTTVPPPDTASRAGRY